MTPAGWSIQGLLKVTAEYLREKGTEAPRLCAEVLLAHQLKARRIDLYLNFDKPLSGPELEGYRSLIRRRLQGEPVQYITGRQEFWSMEFEVGRGVLIPRPESELLVEQSLSLLRGERPHDRQDDPKSPCILDLGTGCGAVILALAREIRDASLFASDISSEALTFAGRNARKLDSRGRIRFFQGDLFRPLKEERCLFDLVATNPPYVAAEDMDTLMTEVRRYEPRIALDGGREGLDCIRKIILESPAFLKPGGWLLVEMDPGQTESALALMERSGQFEDGHRIRDYSHRYRVVAGRRKRRP
ncbi:MAG: peptide chain release factor N(5)-glutamine methyltransferase [Deltaproteobacteria bacterium]|nr:peptide chain release factor N(5)-glutamine methyltransferase [Deltaproteobacteria bacterium]